MLVFRARLRLLFCKMFFYSGFIEFRRVTFFNSNGSLRTFAQAGTQSVTIRICNQFRFAVYQFNCSFGTSAHA